MNSIINIFRRRSFKLSLVKKEQLIGYIFILPWLIGFVVLFLLPMAESLIYSFSEVKISSNGMKSALIGIENYRNALFIDPNYNKELVSSILGIVYDVPIIVIFSMFIAGILNQKFFGRGFARILFFLPVIIASGAIIHILRMGGLSTDISGNDTVYMVKATGLKEILQGAGIQQGLVDFFTNISSRIFDITWKSGIQIILYLAGLQTIPSSFYEVSSLEGASAWEEFWKITFPVLSPISLVVVVYTIIDSFTNYENTVIRLISDSFKNFKYGLSAAQSWLYFLVILIIILFVTKVVFKKVVYIDE